MHKAFWNTSVFSVICLFCGYFLLYNVSLKKVFLESETNNSSDKNKGAITEFANAIDIFSGKGEGSYKVTDDIDIMIKGIREKFVVTKPLLSSYNISCSNKTRPVDSIEDLLCMVTRTSITSRSSSKFSQIQPRTAELAAESTSFLQSPPKFLPEYKNPCWYSEGQRFNCLPYFQLIGCAKCASTDLFDRITSHPDILNSGWAPKETQWWALNRYGNEDNHQFWTEFEFWPDPTKRCRVTALDKCPKLVFAKYLENGWTEFNQILYTHDYQQDLYKYCHS